ncbi:MAG: c-type cytochrome [Anaerolineae bacterium]
MNKQESFALLVVLAIVVGLPLTVFGYQHLYLPTRQSSYQLIDLTAQVPEVGGWRPEVVTVRVGEPVRLRVTSRDVIHGFAIGKLGIEAGMIRPGETKVVEFIPERAGRFTFYCNVWCSPYHYRMRGVLEVIDPTAPGKGLEEEKEPGYPAGLEIDAPHEAEFYPETKPSASQGKGIFAARCATCHDESTLAEPTFTRDQSPSDIFKQIGPQTTPLSEHGSNDTLSEEERWDTVAYLWSLSASPESLTLGQGLYQKNCTGCHGESGLGDGPGSQYTSEPPAKFSQAETMAGGTGQIYHAKIRRGGMGTGMPYWGTIFSQEETWSLVDHLWTFLFSYDSP